MDRICKQNFKRTIKRQPLTAVWRNGGFSASYDSFVVGSSAVLRLNFCAKIRHYAKPQTVISTKNTAHRRASHVRCATCAQPKPMAEEKLKEVNLPKQ
jgi:hypothetical protein